MDDEEASTDRKLRSIADFFGIVPALPNQSDDFKREIDEAMSARVDEIVRRMNRTDQAGEEH